MPFFRYTAIDPSGRQLAGTVQAKDFSHAGELLGAKGLRGVSLHTGATTNVIRTKRVGDKDLLFCLSQIAALTKAGLTPYAAFRNVAQRTRNQALKKACEEIAARTEAGEPASSVMEKYIDIFPHNAVATVRAGEYGGFLPESFQFLADHYSDSAAFKRWFWFLKYTSWQQLLFIGLFAPIIPALWRAFHEGEGWQSFTRPYMQMLLKYTLPIYLGIVLLVFLLIWVLRSHTFTQFRHRFVLNLPWGFGARARNESIRAFLWTLRNLSHAAVPPNTAWALAAGSAPNAEYAMRLAEAGTVLHSEQPLSVAMVQADLFPHDYDQLLKTAEVTGDITGTLDNMLKMTNEDFEIAKTKARAGLSQMGCLVMIIATGVIVILAVYLYYGNVFSEVDKWANE